MYLQVVANDLDEGDEITVIIIVSFHVYVLQSTVLLRIVVGAMSSDKEES